MDDQFQKLRLQYPDFIYDKYEYNLVDDLLTIKYYFSIPNLTTFNPLINLKVPHNISLNDNYLKNLIFHLGLIEIISYIKCTCSPNIIIKAGFLDTEQIKWFQKLYYNGLGEFLYRNEITIKEEDLFNFKIEGQKIELEPINYITSGNLIPVGGGKDSAVVLEMLKNEKDNTAFILNPKKANLACVKEANVECIIAKRIIDSNLIKLNNEGFLNGHTPFSALLSFLSFLVSYIYHKKYIILANEASANEETVLNSHINHQYSKSYEYENDFNNYMTKYFHLDIHYFSLLRPLNEYQIAYLFSHYEKYHPIFKSCNVGSKDASWPWCCNCPKCLFVYIILSPFMDKEKLIDIFKEDLYERKDLLPIFLELSGYALTKPFECVGTYHEVRCAISKVIKKLDKLPYLLEYFKDHYPLEDDCDLINNYNHENNLPTYFADILKKEMQKYDK